MKKLLKGNLSVSESSKPLNNPLVSMKIAYEARFPRYFNLFENSVGQKEPKDWQTFEMFEQARQNDKRLSTGYRLSLQLKS